MSLAPRPDECIICCSNEPPLYRLCSCDTLLHADCARRLVVEVESHRNLCPVCRQSYVFECDSKLVWRCDLLCGFMLCVGVVGTLFPIPPNLLMCTGRSRFCGVFHGILTGVTVVSSALVLYICISLRRSTGRWVPCIIKRETQRTSLQLPSPVAAKETPDCGGASV